MADFEFKESRGDTIKLLVPVVRNNSPVDITGCTMYFTAKRLKADSDAQAVIQKSTAVGDGISFLNAALGQAIIVIDPEDTEGVVDEPRLYCDVQLTELNGTKTTVARGRLTLLNDITKV